MTLKEVVLTASSKSTNLKKGCFVVVKVNEFILVSEPRTARKCKEFAKSQNQILQEKEGILIIPSNKQAIYIDFLKANNSIGVEMVEVKNQEKATRELENVEFELVKRGEEIIGAAQEPAKPSKVLLSMVNVDESWLTKAEQDALRTKEMLDSYELFREENKHILVIFQFSETRFCLINGQAERTFNYLIKTEKKRKAGFAYQLFENRAVAGLIYEIYQVLTINTGKAMFEEILEKPFVFWTEDGVSEIVTPQFKEEEQEKEEQEQPQTDTNDQNVNERLANLEKMLFQMQQEAQTAKQEAQTAKQEAEEVRKKLEMREARKASPEHLKLIIERHEAHQKQVSFLESRLKASEQTTRILQNAQNVILQNPDAEMSFSITVEGKTTVFKNGISGDIPDVLRDIMNYICPLQLERQAKAKESLEKSKSLEIALD